LIKNKFKGNEQEMTIELELAVEERKIDHIDFVYMWEDLDTLEKRVILQSYLIQNFKLESGEEEM
jgi:hypothetical protein